MSKLFATHLLQTTTSSPIGGHYDSEQELWVGDNLLRGTSTITTYPGTVYSWSGVTYTWTGCGYEVQDDNDIWEKDEGIDNV